VRLDFYVSAYSVSGNIGQQRGLLFLLICLVGNLINVLMEEGIFRGLFQKVFERKTKKKIGQKSRLQKAVFSFKNFLKKSTK